MTESYNDVLAEREAIVEEIMQVERALREIGSRGRGRKALVEKLEYLKAQAREVKKRIHSSSPTVLSSWQVLAGAYNLLRRLRASVNPYDRNEIDETISEIEGVVPRRFLETER